jgi:putative phosphoribosyl transferase
MIFQDRTEAGQLLAKELQFEPGEDVLVIALPRGGVPLGAEIAQVWQAPLDLVITRKIGAPFNPEYAIGSLAEKSEPLLNTLETNKLSKEWLEQAVAEGRKEIVRRQAMYFENHTRQSIKGKTVVLVDDGIATGYTIFAAIEEIQKQEPKRVILAIPVMPIEMALQLRKKVDEIVSLSIPKHYLGSVGDYYKEFQQLSDREVKHLLAQARS